MVLFASLHVGLWFDRLQKCRIKIGPSYIHSYMNLYFTKSGSAQYEEETNIIARRKKTKKIIYIYRSIYMHGLNRIVSQCYTMKFPNDLSYFKIKIRLQRLLLQLLCYSWPHLTSRTPVMSLHYPDRLL